MRNRPLGSAVRSWIKLFWVFESCSNEPVPETTVADGFPELIIHFRSPFAELERDGGLVYVAQPGGRSPTEFVLTELDKKRAVFENPLHDYPQRIVYELSKEGALTASIGFAKGSLQSNEYKREGK